MLKELTLTNFKSFAEPQTIPFAPVTIFVGANGSGKSNAFDAIRFIQGICLGLQIGEVLIGRYAGGRQVFEGLRGGVGEVAWNPGSPVTLGVSTAITSPTHSSGNRNGMPTPNRPLSDELIDLSYRIKFDLMNPPTIDEEELRYTKNGASENVLFAGRFIESGPVVMYGEMKSTYVFDDTYFLGSTLRLSQFADDRWVSETIASFARIWDQVQVFDLRPAEMRDYADSRVSSLESTGRNFSAVLQKLCESEDVRERLIEWTSALCAPVIRNFDFVTTALGDVMLQLVEGDDATRRSVSAKSMSDGTLRFLGKLTAAFAAPPGSVLLFEEIENGLHPTRLHLLVELFEQIAATRGIQIIATTHSPQVLLALSEPALRDVVLFARNEEHPGTIVRRLGDLEHFDEVTQRTRIDELFTTGWLEFAV